jgi:MOSC domain-containing protein YiiM
MSQDHSPRIASIHIGRIAPLGPQAVPSGFVKHRVEGSVTVAAEGLAGDEQADRTVHGGPEKAVYAYALSHYPIWSAAFPAHAEQFGPGSMGENLAIEGMDEMDLCVGDIHAIGDVLLQVCQPRQPCFKFALRFGNNRLPKAMVQSERSGWYYSVVRGGRIMAGHPITLLERPNPDFPFSRLVQIVYRGQASIDELTRMAEMPGLASQWRQQAQTAVGALGNAPSQGMVS